MRHHRRSVRRTLTIALLTAVTASLVACGDDGVAEPGTTVAATTPGTETPGTETSGTSGYPTDPDAAVIRIGAEDEFPTLVIGGDGWVYTTDAAWTSGDSQRPRHRSIGPAAAGRLGAAVPAIAPPAPTPMPMSRRQLTPEALATVLALGEELDLFGTPPEYEDVGVTDAGTTVVVLTDGDGTYTHDAYALGYDDESGARGRLDDFVRALHDLPALVGDDGIGPGESYVPAVYSVSIGTSNASAGVEPVWPADLEVVEGCQELPIDRFEVGVSGRYVADVDGESRLVNVIPDLPGDACNG